MKRSFWKDKRVLVTGSEGFLGHHLMPLLKKTGGRILAPAYPAVDLREPRAVQRLFRETRPDIVIHMAVHGGGIGYMKAHPASIFYDNIMMNTLMVEASRRFHVQKFVGIGTICSYPKFTPVPFKEGDLWSGYPEETNAPYGLAKKMMLVQTQIYRRQHGLNGIHLLPTNMYGPHDHFNLDSSHVIPALIIKFHEAAVSGSPEVVVWGSGRVSREFLYVGDGARAIVMATQRYEDAGPVNIGSGCETTIRELAYLIGRLTGFRGRIVWDTSKPDGQPRRRLDTSRARKAFGFQATTGLKTGLKRTIAWFKKYRPHEKNHEK